MKVKTSLLPLLILGSLSVLGFREHPSQEIARRAVCVVRCNEEFNNGTSVPHPEDCLDECSTHLRHIPVIESEAKANIQYMCHRDESSVFLRMDPGVFIVEFRNQSSDWVDDKIVFDDDVYGKNKSTSYEDGPYQLRFTRVFVDSISNPETTDWFTVFEPGLRSEKRLDVRLHCLSVDADTVFIHTPLYMTAHILLIPGKDVGCAYTITCSEAGGTYNKTKSITFFRREMQEVTFENLPYAANFTVTVWDNFSSTTEEAAGMEFSTPFSEDRLEHKKICVPDEVAELEASVTSYKDGNIYDVNVTWRTPDYASDFFIVNITTDGAESTRTRVPSHIRRGIRSFHTIFKDIKILQTYNVSVMGYSYIFRGGPEASKHFELPQRTIDSLDTIIVGAVLSCMSLVVIIGVLAYLMHRRKRLRQKKTKVFSMDDWEIVPGRLVVSRVLGTGAFGIVKLGKLRDNEGRVTDVAVKMLRDNTNETERRYFFLEIEMMKSLGSHPNIVSLLDYRTVGLSPFLVLEYCPRGDLLAFLHSVLQFETPTSLEDEKEEACLSRTGTSEQDATLHENSQGSPATPEFSSGRSNPSILFPGMESRETCRRDFRASMDPGELNDAFVPDQDATLTVLDMLNFGRQIATGMEFLSSNRIVHCDLAARNVLLCDDRVVKISDFGLSRDVYQQNMYRKTGNGRMPLKWMAIESLTHRVFTTRSDVWSFGILLWEIFTLGGTPYPEVPDVELLKVLQSGYRMKRPENSGKAQYNLMLACWKTKPKNRPTFTYLREELDKLMCMASDIEYLDMADPSLEAPCIEENPETSSTTSSSHDTSFQLQVGSAAVN